MSVELITITQRYQGLSTDNKPTDNTVNRGARFFEEDTGLDWRYNGTSWGLVGTVVAGTDGEKLSITDDGAAETHVYAHSYPDVSVHLVSKTGVTDTLQSPSTAGSRDIVISNGTLWAVGNKVKIPGEYDILTIKVIATNTLSFDRYLDIAHDSGTTVTGVTQNMKAAGSAANPVIYEYEATEREHIHGIHIVISTTSEPALFRFGGLDALGYGIHFRVVGGTRTNTYWIPFRTNNSMVLSGFTYSKETKVGTDWFAHLRVNLEELNNNIIILLAGESLQVLIQDNLAAEGTLNSLEIKIDKHEEN